MAAGTIQKNMVLLWENPNPTSDYSGGTLSIDLSVYDFLIVQSGFTGTTVVQNSIMFKNITTRVIAPVHAASNNNLVFREYNVTESSIEISNGTLYTQGTADGAARPGYGKPLKIYGVKF